MLKMSTILLLIYIYIPLESFISSNLPIPESVYNIVRFLPELLIYFLCIYTIIKKAIGGTTIKTTFFDIFFIGLFLCGIISTLYNRAPIAPSVVAMRPMFRYIPLIYIIANTKIEESFIKNMIYATLALALLETVLSLYQHSYGVSKYFLPRATDLSVAGEATTFSQELSTSANGGREIGSVYGTTGDPVYLALFLMHAFVVGLAVLMGFRLKVWEFITVSFINLLVLYTIFLTYSRGTVLCAIMVIPIMMVFYRKPVIMVLLGFAAACTVGPYLAYTTISASSNYVSPKLEETSPIDNIIELFTTDYFSKSAEDSRGFVIEEIGVPVISSFSLIGYSPDEDFARDKIAYLNPTFFDQIVSYAAVDDTFLIAVICYYGLIGFAFFMLMLAAMFFMAAYVYLYSDRLYFGFMGMVMMLTVIVAIPYAMIVRTFFFRTYAVYFWIYAGLVFLEYYRLRALSHYKALGLIDESAGSSSFA
jgi:hypothetical protein